MNLVASRWYQSYKNITLNLKVFKYTIPGKHIDLLLSMYTLLFTCVSSNSFTVKCISLLRCNQVVTSENASFKVVPLKTTNGIFIEFTGASIPPTEGIFVCHLSGCGK